jgi:hypothetical protein
MPKKSNMENALMPESQSRIERWTKTLTLVGAVITMAGAVVGGLWSFYTYTETKEKEFYTYFWNKKMELFLRTTNAASEMATSASLESFNKARNEYWEMFYGPLSLVEGPCVKRAMEVFSQCVPKDTLMSSDRLPMHKLKQPSYRLAVRLKEELASSWQIPFSELKLINLPDKCDYGEETICK